MKLREWLAKNGISQVAFSRLIGVNKSHLSSVICGERIAGRKISRSIERETNGAILEIDMLMGTAQDKIPFGVGGLRPRTVSE